MPMKLKDALLVKGIGGFYYVEAAGAVYECKARGVFRKEGITPLAGDRVEITVAEDGCENSLDAIAPRRNQFARPPVANIDILFLVVSTCEPKPNLLVTDRLCAIAEDKGVEPAVILTKGDLSPVDSLYDIYRTTGLQVFVCDGTQASLTQIRQAICGRVCAFTGNSGVGKSTLLNRLEPALALDTGEISAKLGRGRHTTRSAELFHVAGGYVVDTPGFSSLDFTREQPIGKEHLAGCFREFRPYLGGCKFTSCAHVGDSGCNIVKHVDSGEISVSRHASYVQLYQEVKDIKAWEK